MLPAGLVVAVDQASKALAVRHLRSPPPRRCRGIGVGVVINSHGALSVARSASILLVLWIGASVGFVVLLGSGALQTDVARVGLAVALGGASSNVADRVLRGGIVDFLKLPLLRVFNVADAAIVFGVATVLVERH